MKKLATVLICVVVSISMIGCGSNNSSESSEEPTDLTGTWETEDNNGSWMEATIEGDVISIDWISDNGDTKSIYWVGTYVAPTENTKDYTWTSERDKDATDNALLASTSDTKEFTYDGDSISTEVSALGTTTTMHFYPGKTEGTEQTEETESEAEPEDEIEEDTEKETDAGTEEKAEKENQDGTYGIGDTWTVEGQWELTVDSVTTTDERNEFEESDPAQVIIVDYHYENLGYEDEDGIMDGLYLDFENAIDADGNMCTSYPAVEIDEYPQETPVGAKCSAQCAFGLKDKGDTATLNISQYDGNGVEQKASFDVSF